MTESEELNYEPYEADAELGYRDATGAHGHTFQILMNHFKACEESCDRQFNKGVYLNPESIDEVKEDAKIACAVGKQFCKRFEVKDMFEIEAGSYLVPTRLTPYTEAFDAEIRASKAATAD